MRPRFAEGDWFAVPLEQGGWAIGRIARLKKSILLGYFFGPRRDVLPAQPDLEVLRPADAIYVHRFGYLGLRAGDWPVLGGHENWSRTDWPMPAFRRREPSGNRMWRVEYDDHDPNRVTAERRIVDAEFACLPDDGLAGSGYIEGILSKMLAIPSPRDARLESAG